MFGHLFGELKRRKVFNIAGLDAALDGDHSQLGWPDAVTLMIDDLGADAT